MCQDLQLSWFILRIILSGGHVTNGGHPGRWEQEKAGDTWGSVAPLIIAVSDFMDNLTLGE